MQLISEALVAGSLEAIKHQELAELTAAKHSGFAQQPKLYDAPPANRKQRRAKAARDRRRAKA